MQSIFMDKSIKPTDHDLLDKLGTTFPHWFDIKSYLNDILISPSGEWNYSGKKYGWSFRMKSKKRNIIYFLPRDGFFKVAFVFGQKATDKVLKSNVAESIKHELQNAKVYAEGRGLRIEIRNADLLQDIRKLIQIKLDQ